MSVHTLTPKNTCAHTIQTFAAFCLHSALLGVIALIIKVNSSVDSIQNYLHYFCFCLHACNICLHGFVIVCTHGLTACANGVFRYRGSEF